MKSLSDLLLLPRYRRSEHEPTADSVVYAVFLATGATLPHIAAGMDGLIYIGKAAGAKGFAKRCHFDGARTLNHSPRKSLAGLLAGQLNLVPEAHPPEKWGLTFASDGVLTDWMREHLRIAYVSSETVDSLERRLISHYAPPLNLTLCLQSPQHRLVKRQRDKLKALAYAKIPQAMTEDAQPILRKPLVLISETRKDTAPDIAARYGLKELQYRNALRKQRFAWHSLHTSWDVLHGSPEWRQMIQVAEAVSRKCLGELD